jgi:hypothetical protein
MTDTEKRFVMRIKPGLHARLAAAAEARGESMTTLVTEAIEAAIGDFDPGLVLGYVQLAGGELEASDCPECGRPMTETWVGFTAGPGRPVLFGPVCSLCAGTE